MIYSNVLELIGNTPLVRYNDNISLKLEFYNPSNSVKDRASYSMLKTAQEKGEINSDTVIIEPTSGNTGIGLAMCCAVMGLKLIIVMPENMSEERRKVIRAYGAELVLTPKEKGMQGAVDKAKELISGHKNSYMPMQFSNPANPSAHEFGTAKEIFDSTDGDVDIVAAGIGTGGTAIGVKKGLSKLKPDIKVFGVEPKESPLLTEGRAGGHKIQGIGANFVTDIYKSGEIDGVIDIEGDTAIKEARELACKYGILCGISSGANLAAAKLLSEKYPDKKIVTIICDFGERYLSTELFK
ncbi:MAG: cysteine synthase A [Candidatus Gastranaerophilales bacterium]|nr:cysteine synthase A [Candidatus Gastranaerophilales bacterium]